MHLSLLILSMIIAAAAAFVAVWSPDRDGQRFAFLRQLTSGTS
jgi:hypothetical protein